MGPSSFYHHRLLPSARTSFRHHQLYSVTTNIIPPPPTSFHHHRLHSVTTDLIPSHRSSHNSTKVLERREKKFQFFPKKECKKKKPRGSQIKSVRARLTKLDESSLSYF